MSDLADLNLPTTQSCLSVNNGSAPGEWVTVHVNSAGHDTVLASINGSSLWLMEVIVNGQKVFVECDTDTKVPSDVANILQEAGLSP